MRFIEREKMPYVVIGPGYPCTDVTVFRDFPDVYSPEFKAKADEWARQYIFSCDYSCISSE